jgi:hypothetical protein
MSADRYLVILPAEYAFEIEAYGPFSTYEAAERAAARWTAGHPGEEADVITLRPGRALPGATAADSNGE